MVLAGVASRSAAAQELGPTTPPRLHHPMVWPAIAVPFAPVMKVASVRMVFENLSKGWDSVENAGIDPASKADCCRTWHAWNRIMLDQADHVQDAHTSAQRLLYRIDCRIVSARKHRAFQPDKIVTCVVAKGWITQLFMKLY